MGRRFQPRLRPQHSRWFIELPALAAVALAEAQLALDGPQIPFIEELA